ncbi:unnamed protein product [Amoebophrya sp. A25]|nr:unnamed protein product [Amoebophrya sp. A25]|eukprot:GSA25T00007182001.1
MRSMQQPNILMPKLLGKFGISKTAATDHLRSWSKQGSRAGSATPGAATPSAAAGQNHLYSTAALQEANRNSGVEQEGSAATPTVDSTATNAGATTAGGTSISHQVLATSSTTTPGTSSSSLATSNKQETSAGRATASTSVPLAVTAYGGGGSPTAKAIQELCGLPASIRERYGVPTAGGTTEQSIRGNARQRQMSHGPPGVGRPVPTFGLPQSTFSYRPAVRNSGGGPSSVTAVTPIMSAAANGAVKMTFLQQASGTSSSTAAPATGAASGGIHASGTAVSNGGSTASSAVLSSPAKASSAALASSVTSSSTSVFMPGLPTAPQTGKAALPPTTNSTSGAQQQPETDNLDITGMPMDVLKASAAAAVQHKSPNTTAAAPMVQQQSASSTSASVSGSMMAPATSSLGFRFEFGGGFSAGTGMTSTSGASPALEPQSRGQLAPPTLAQPQLNFQRAKHRTVTPTTAAAQSPALPRPPIPQPGTWSLENIPDLICIDFDDCLACAHLYRDTEDIAAWARENMGGPQRVDYLKFRLRQIRLDKPSVKICILSLNQVERIIPVLKDESVALFECFDQICGSDAPPWGNGKAQRMHVLMRNFQARSGILIDDNSDNIMDAQRNGFHTILERHISYETLCRLYRGDYGQ